MQTGSIQLAKWSVGSSKMKIKIAGCRNKMSMREKNVEREKPTKRITRDGGPAGSADSEVHLKTEFMLHAWYIIIIIINSSTNSSGILVMESYATTPTQHQQQQQQRPQRTPYSLCSSLSFAVVLGVLVLLIVVIYPILCPMPGWLTEGP